MNIPLPMSLLLELTHRCPLQCPYCSNPLILQSASDELSTSVWLNVIDQAAQLGILQVHLSGGEPTVRKDLPVLIAKAAAVGIYTNLITSGVLLDEAKIIILKENKLDHLQLSFQDIDAINADSISNFAGSHKRKLKIAKLIKEYDIPLTLNFVLHKLNIESVKDMIDFASNLEVAKVEIAHTQYYGWGLINKAYLAPSNEQILEANLIIEKARHDLGSKMRINYVLPDLDALYPKKCMGGWGTKLLNITPNGKVLPCHAAETLPHLIWPSVKDSSLHDIWFDSEGFNAFRGTKWMQEPCLSCPLQQVDYGGCRCQAYALTGDPNATDPACSLSPLKNLMVDNNAVAPKGTMSYRAIGSFNM
jgi:pyrroloquinoline quinone biosynthesis protein E